MSNPGGQYRFFQDQLLAMVTTMVRETLYRISSASGVVPCIINSTWPGHMKDNP